MADKAYFVPAFGNRPEHIVGRDAIIDSFIDGLSKPVGHKQRATLVLGQRGMGKTALLLEIFERAKAKGFVVARVAASQDMLNDIIEYIQIDGARYADEAKPPVKGFSVGAVGFSFGLTFNDRTREDYGFRVKLDLLCEKLNGLGHGVLLLIDEVQSNSAEMRTLTTTYQHLVGSDRNIAIMMAGLPNAISAVLNDKVLTFLNRAHKVHLGPLSLEDVRAYYAQVFAKLNKSIDDQTLDDAVRASRGYPYLLQLIGYYLLEYCGDSNVIEPIHARRATASARAELVENIFQPSLGPLSDVDRAFIDAMALDDGVTKIADMRVRMGVSAQYVQTYRARLLDAGVIDSPRIGEVEFAIPYLKEYLRGEL
jgi:hypothetical protein